MTTMQQYGFGDLEKHHLGLFPFTKMFPFCCDTFGITVW